MNTLKHVALTIALHAALLTVAHDHDRNTFVDNAATPLRENRTRTRLMQQDRMLRLEFHLPATGAALVTLLNAQGHVILREHIAGSGAQVRELPNTNGSMGPYTMTIEQDGITLLKKLVIEQA
jgi:hypothetical protein